MDNFTKEELIKLIKKYVILQKQLKAKNEELTNRLNESNQSFSPVSFKQSVYFFLSYNCIKKIAFKEQFSNKKLEEENLELKAHIQVYIYIYLYINRRLE